MKTITVQIGNSDDKLSQKDWSEYFAWVDSEVRARATEVHFCGMSLPEAIWQNACWVFSVKLERDWFTMKRMISNAALYYQQDSFAWTEGETEIVKS